MFWYVNGAFGPSQQSYAPAQPIATVQEYEDHTSHYVNRLSSKISIDIGKEVNEQNQFLDSMRTDFEKSENVLSQTLMRLRVMAATQGGGMFLYLTLFIVGVVSFIYFKVL
ncbi:hypothetical protein ROZALSC1DRAFT_21936 [Rozella allomycis CSF55]|uniref:t-SNARE coiled-coil homology domain-containing protein n=1 Tax=Rozella allomycis (strain CSF55) TaxID=988480 RepID=A0A4P9YKZ2_ROZAC|nr:hypothetical protein ROZALSC1DRAFT_21936 [Rozella allomycis CSF55]